MNAARTKHALLATLPLILLLIGGAAMAASPAKEFSPKKIGKKVPSAAGAVAWSPDGVALAYITTHLVIHNLSTGDDVNVGIDGPRFLHWGGDGVIRVLASGGQGGSVLVMVSPEGKIIEARSLDVNASSAYPLPGGLALLRSELFDVSFGVDVHIGVYRLGPPDTPSREVYFASRAQPRKTRDYDFIRGWINAGPSPLDEALLLQQYIDPPAFAPYVKLVLVDPRTGSIRNVLRMKEGVFRGSGSWNPRGDRMAIVTYEDSLRIISVSGEMVAVDNEITGSAPAWNPRGSQIFFGGYLVSSDGAAKVQVIDGDAFGFWSPDGRKLALVESEKLWVLEGFEPSLLEADKPYDKDIYGKIAILRDLLDEGLIQPEEYEGRMARLLASTPSEP